MCCKPAACIRAINSDKFSALYLPSSVLIENAGIT